MENEEALSLKPLLVSKEHQLLGPLLSQIKDTDEDIGYGYNAKISGFVNPKALPQSADKTLAYTGSVSLVVFRSNPQRLKPEKKTSSTVKKVLLVLDLSEGFSDRKKNLFLHLGIQYLNISECGPFSLAISNLSRLAQQQKPCVGAREQNTEAEAYEILSEACRKSALIFLPEVSAEDLFFQQFSDTKIDYRLRGYLKKTTFDGVVATLPPYSRPVAAIEVDGSVHDEPGKSEKDKKKDQICKMADFPLFRLDVRNGLEDFKNSRQQVLAALSVAFQTLFNQLDTFNTWEKYIQHELNEMSDPWSRGDLKALIGKTMEDITRLKKEIAQLAQPNPFAEIQEQDFEDQARMEAEYKASQEEKSRLRMLKNIREELFDDPLGMPLRPLSVYCDESTTSKVGWGVEFMPRFTLRPRYKGLGFKEEISLESIRLPMLMQLPKESREVVSMSIFDAIESLCRDRFFSEFDRYFLGVRSKIERKLDEKIRRLSRIQ